MRHLRDKRRRLSRTSEHRLALRRNMAQSLFEHGQITTTLPKTKNLRPFAERIIRLAVKARKLAASDPAGSLRARRRIHALLDDRAIIPKEHTAAYSAMSDAHRARSLRSPSGRRYRTGEPKGRLEFTAESVIHRLVDKIGARFADRSGGYTRVIRLSGWRVGDSAPLAMLQLVGDEQPPGAVTKPKRSARRRRADARYSFAANVLKKKATKPKPAEAGAEGQS